MFFIGKVKQRHRKTSAGNTCRGNYNCFCVVLAERILEAAFFPILTFYVYIAYLFHEELLNPAAHCGCGYIRTACFTHPGAECAQLDSKIMEQHFHKTECSSSWKSLLYFPS